MFGIPYIYNCLIFNKLHNFLIFQGISDDVAAARRAWALPCVPGIQGFKDLRFKCLKFKDLRFKDSRIAAVKKFKIVVADTLCYLLPFSIKLQIA